MCKLQLALAKENFMSLRNLKLACQILEAMDNTTFPRDQSLEARLKHFNEFEPHVVENNFRLLCEHGCFLLDDDEKSWSDANFVWHFLSWKGHDLLEKLKKEL